MKSISSDEKNESPPARRRRALACAILVGVLVVTAGCQGNWLSERDRTDIHNVLVRQRMSWNDGALEDFMDGYRRSEATVFAGGGQFRRGWQTVLERYRSSYPDAEAMGRLTFDDLEIEEVGPDAALVLGSWHLEWDASRTAGGVFTLLFRRYPEGWRIDVDHTSSVPAAAPEASSP